MKLQYFHSKFIIQFHFTLTLNNFGKVFSCKETLISFCSMELLRKQGVRVSGISFQGHGPRTRISWIVLFKCIYLSSRKHFLSEITGHAWERIWSIRGLLCFNKFKAAIYESFYDAAIVKPLRNNNHNYFCFCFPLWINGDVFWIYLLCRFKATNYCPLLYQLSIAFCWWFFLFFFLYQRLFSKPVEFMVQTSLLQWKMWYF